jgi:hypothetical protein
LWGTFSPADHLRPAAFVADVLIYDRLVVPVAPQPGDPLAEKWAQRWDPERQAELLGVIRDAVPHLVIEVPWDHHLAAEWKEHERQRTAGFRESAVRQVADDVAEVQRRQRANPDSPKQQSERQFLRDRQRRKNDAVIADTIPTAGMPTLVAAYGSAAEFDESVTVEPAADGLGRNRLLGAFAWPLLVPSSNRRSDVDLLKQAMEMVTDEKMAGYRAAYHAWRRELLEAEVPADQAAAELVQLMDAYHQSVHRKRITAATRYAVLVAGSAVGAAITALAGPGGWLLAAAGGGVTSSSVAVAGAWRLQGPSARAAPAALFHEARERFGGWG